MTIVLLLIKFNVFYVFITSILWIRSAMDCTEKYSSLRWASGPLVRSASTVKASIYIRQIRRPCTKRSETDTLFEHVYIFAQRTCGIREASIRSQTDGCDPIRGSGATPERLPPAWARQMCANNRRVFKQRISSKRFFYNWMPTKLDASNQMKDWKK